MLSILKDASNKNEIEFSIYEDNMISPLAVAKLSENDNHIKINLINVDRNYRSRGYGSRILTEIVKTYQYKKIVVTTFSYLKNWYEKFGFKKTGENGNIYFMEREPLE
ncbi:MAG: GNAT family N-acetyltransferase [Candidatus Odinarchaeia archaeon]